MNEQRIPPPAPPFFFASDLGDHHAGRRKLKPQRAPLLLLVFSIALSPAFAEPVRKNRSRDGNPGLERLRQMGYNGPVKPALRDQPVVEAQGVPTTWYVAPPASGGSNANDGLSDTTPFQTIQFAMVQATSGDEILVLPGTFNECINNTAFALGTQKNLSVIADDWVQSGNRGSTIIDGNGACAEPFSVVNLAGNGSPGSRLEGFTIRNAADSGVFVIGSGIVTENVITSNNGLDGGGIFAYPGTCYYGTAAIDISNNTISNNTADDKGSCNPGGETCTNDGQCATGATCAIFGGNGGGLYIRGRAVNAGGAIGCIGGDARVTVTNNVIDGNGADFAFGGGLYAKTDAETGRLSTVSITQNLISNNTTLPFSLGYGGGAWLGTFGYGTEQIDFDDNTVSSNLTTGDGGGVSAWVDTQMLGNHTINMTNNDVIANQAEGAGGGLDLFQISREVGGGLSKLNATDNSVDQNEALGTNPASFSPGIGGGVIINAWSEETLNPNSGIEFSRNDVLQNTTSLAGGGVGVIVRADADHADDALTQDASSTVTLDNNLIALNTATDGGSGTTAMGGGVFVFLHGEGGDTFPATSTVRMNQNTVAENTADTGSGGIEIESYTILDSGMTLDADTAIQIGSSIIYDNSGFGIGGPTPGGTPSITVPDWVGRPNTGNLTITNDFNSLFMNGAGGNQAPLVTDGANDQFVDPLLSSALIPLQCSPTIDAGGAAAIPGNEPQPNGGRFNLGHTGGQTNATKTLADATGDGFVDGVDILRLSAAFATFDGDARYDASVDLDKDLFVGPIDLVLMAVNFAQSCP